MSDLRDLLRTTAASGSETVDLAEDTVLGRIRHRRARNRRFAVGGVAVATAAVVAGAAWIVRPEQPPVATGPALRIINSDVDSPSGMEASFQATLSADANGCVVGSAGQEPVALVWPRGYTVRGDSKSFEILDGPDHVVARSGVPLSIGGGGATLIDSWPNADCARDGRLWMVGAITSR
jgi:hypothetical protein